MNVEHIYVLAFFEGYCINIFHFFWSHSNPGTKIYKISKLQLGMFLLTHFMAKTVMRNEFTRCQFMVFGLFEGQSINVFHFSWSHSNPGTQIDKISKLQLGMFLQTHFMAKTVMRNEFTVRSFRITVLAIK